MTAKARKLLDKMRNSKNGWNRKDIDSLYLGFGFIMKHGSSHDIIVHPVYPQLRTTLPRHTFLAKGYVEFAVSMIDKLLELQSSEGSKNENGK